MDDDRLSITDVPRSDDPLASMPIPRIIVSVSERRRSWRYGHRLMWTLDMAEVGATQSRARIADAELMVRDYLSNAGFGHVRPAPEVILYRFDPITLHRARRP